MRQKFNDGWKFLKMPYGTGMEEMRQQEEAFREVDIPHDWLIYDTADLYGDGRGWYRKQAYIPKKEGEHIFLYFEGVYMDSEVYVNGKKAREWKYGYSSFEVDLTEYLNGRTEEILVSVSHKSPNSRWYSGAGIYRDVWLKTVPETYVVTDSIYIATGRPKGKVWHVAAEAELAGSQAAGTDCVFTISRNGNVVSSKRAAAGPERVLRRAVLEVEDPMLWDIDAPVMYEMTVTWGSGLQETVRFGFKYVEFNTEEGFFLNSRRIKLHGVCEHHDFGCLGAAYSHEAMRRKFKILKAMGVNALRTAHNMPAPDLMELADEMGILIVSEAFDMWEMSKTVYDYSRFFKEWAHTDVASWVRRDRNHPSLIMWSIGNEIYDTHADAHGQEITRQLKQWVEAYDPYGNAPVTLGSNFLPWENARKCTDIVKLAGYNYGEKYYGRHHKEYPDWYIYGSETASVVHSRGIYHFPLKKPMLAEDDEQCSALGNSTTSWGADSIEKCITDDRDAAFCMGQFIWTGFDYIGEPTPYHTKNSYFGQIDTAGFPKDSYYTFQAEWTDCRKNPMVHIFPYWDFNPGQLIDVRICSNAPEVELFVNGKSLGRQQIDHIKGESLIKDWQVPYEPGEIRAAAYDGQGRLIAEESRHSFGDSERITVTADKSVMNADGRDLVFVEIGTADRDGYPVENAVDYVEVTVTGAGRLVGLDNGDSTDYDSYKGTKRRLFSGKLLAVIAARTRPGEVTIRVSGKNLMPAKLILKAVECGEVSGITAAEENSPLPCTNEKVWVRKVEMSSPQGQLLTPERNNVEVYARIFPPEADCKELVWSAVTEAGIISPIAEVKAQDSGAVVSARADGEFMVRCTADNGTGRVKIISQMEFKVEGLGRPFLNPYEFVAGGLYNRSVGEVGNGNEKGVSSSRDGRSQIGFTDVDFGTFGSDEITIPVFALDAKPYRIEIWEGMADEEGSEKLADVIYQKPSIWNVYQPETYRLSRRLKGVATLCLVLYEKVHIKGFFFTRQEKAFAKLYGSDSGHVYGDSFVRNGRRVEGIGNNVTLEYEDMDFGEGGTVRITLCGRTPLPKNTVHIRFTGEGRTQTQIVEFTRSAEYEEQSFALQKTVGMQKVELVFLPGSNFDLEWVQFG